MSLERRNPALDALRATAIAAVLVAHLVPGATLIGTPASEAIAVLAQRGVDLFFVLSGFLIGGIVLGELVPSGRIAIGRFWSRRWLRTLPAYYVTLAFYALKTFLPHQSTGLGQPLAYVVFAQTYVLGNVPDFAHSWSLCVEEHFYLVLPIVLALGARLGLRTPARIAALVGGIALALLVLRTVTGGDGTPRLSHYRTDGLCVGVLLAALAAGRPRWLQALGDRAAWLGPVAALLTIGAGALNLVSSIGWQTAFALAFGLWVALGAGRGAWLVRVGDLRPVRWMSRVSYSLYLLHPLVIGTLDVLWFRRHGGTWAMYAVQVVLCVVAALVASELSYRFVERTFLKLRDKWVPHVDAQPGSLGSEPPGLMPARTAPVSSSRK